MAKPDNPMGFSQEQLDNMEATHQRYNQFGKDIVRAMLFDGEMTDEQFKEIEQFAKFMKMRDNGEL
ncbi:MAG TPA: hypothetical protein PKU80_10975 [Candidatus Limiplasma sp.]|nr:hypothetical protein [Candidatus Limiplasma sp.]